MQIDGLTLFIALGLLVSVLIEVGIHIALYKYYDQIIFWGKKAAEKITSLFKKHPRGKREINGKK